MGGAVGGAMGVDTLGQFWRNYAAQPFPTFSCPISRLSFYAATSKGGITSLSFFVRYLEIQPLGLLFLRALWAK